MTNLIRLLLPLMIAFGIAPRCYSQSALRKAEKAFDRHNYSEALHYFEMLEHGLAAEPDIAFRTGYCKLLLGDVAGAVASFNNAIAADSLNPEYLHYRGIAREKLKDYRGAIADIRKAVKGNPVYELYYLLGQLQIATSDFRGCMHSFNLAVQKNPTDTALYSRAVCRHRAGEYESALQDYNFAIAKNGNNDSFLCGRGMVKMELRDVNGAAADFTRAIELNPSSAELYVNRSDSRKQLASHAEAIEDLNKAIELGRKDDVLFFSRGHLKEELKDYAGAISDYTVAIEKKPDNSSYYYARAQAKARKKDRRGAIEDFKKYLDLVPGDVTSLLNLSELYFLTGDYQKCELIAGDALLHSRKTRYRAISLFLICSSGRILNKDISEAETKLNKLLEEDFSPSWSFLDIEESLPKSGISPEHRTYVVSLITRLRNKEK
jgi:tetratricopeptide (TPR) repeat protein